ncbi:hypothetical protein [Vogesella sp. XCS3]|uniref:hypothetical protein n=1 Tax=Vogesella sp. XCS3 TaxID=2877939 RepID=UPI001D0A4327|nr:hypothetical protein [Vogesella sp. XCS3]UDM18933.1 hypothetical protein LCH97_17980 [Vogesella sp. XCS3]
MEEQTQQEYLKAVKTELGVEWDRLAELAGIAPRALKTYRMPVESKNYRGMSQFVRDAIERVLQEHRRRMKKASKSA